MPEQTSEKEPLLTDAEVAQLPVDERIAIALASTGMDESDVYAAMSVVLPFMAADLRGLADQIEWRYRSMTFYRGGCESTTRLHPSGQAVRDYADTLSVPPESGRP